MLRRLLSLLVFVLLTTTLATAQSHPGRSAKAPKRTATAVSTALPTAISGMATSARHCVSSTTTNAHLLGWAPQGSRFTITFSSDFDPIASLSLVQLGGEASDGESDFDDFIDDDSGDN